MRSALFVALLLAGCTPERVKECPAPVPITRYVYVPIDEALTREVEDDLPPSQTVLDAVAASKVRREKLAVCNARLGAIRALQGTEIRSP